MSIRREIIKSCNLHNGKYTKATSFLLPLYGYSKDYYTNYLIQTYIVNSKDPNLVFIFDNFDEEDLMMHIYKLTSHYCFDESWMDDEDREICISMKIPSNRLDDYNLFLNGSYSKLSESYKEELIKCWGKAAISVESKDIKGNWIGYKTSIFDTIYPTKSKREAISKRLNAELPEDAEVLDKVDLDQEIYRNIKEFKEKYGKEE